MDAKKLNLDDVKAGLKRLLPVLKTVAAITPNKFDDMAVAFLEQLLNNPAAMEAAVANAYA
jgi:hypothetical protein